MLAEHALQERAYFSGADVTIRLEGHPDEAHDGAEIDAAFFQLTAGDTPMPIYSYARRWGRLYDRGVTGEQGGNAFDDVALSNRLVQLELILNQDRFKSHRYAFLPMTHIGHVRVEYKRDTWAGRRVTGYLLARGRVQRSGYEVNVRGATFPAVSIVFDDLMPIVDGEVLVESEFAEEPLPEGTIEVGELELAVETVELTSFRVFYRDGAGPEREYGTGTDPVSGERRWPSSGTLTRCLRSNTQSFQLFGGTDEVMAAHSFVGGVVAAGDDLWVWSPHRAGGAGYVRLEGRYTPERRATDRLDEDLLGEIATILFA